MTDRLADVAHRPPHQRSHPVQRRYQRGPVAAPDGGAFDPERADRSDDDTPDDATEDESTEEPTPLKDIDHTPPDGAEVNEVYRRGASDE